MIVDDLLSPPWLRRRGRLVAVAEPDPGGDRGRRGGYAGEPDAVMLAERT